MVRFYAAACRAGAVAIVLGRSATICDAAQQDARCRSCSVAHCCSQSFSVAGFGAGSVQRQSLLPVAVPHMMITTTTTKKKKIPRECFDFHCCRRDRSSVDHPHVRCGVQQQEVRSRRIGSSRGWWQKMTNTMVAFSNPFVRTRGSDRRAHRNVIMTECELRSFSTQNTCRMSPDEDFYSLQRVTNSDILLWSFIYMPCEVRSLGTQNTCRMCPDEDFYSLQTVSFFP